MASMTIEGAGFSYTKNASNAAAQTIFAGAALALGYKGSLSDFQAILNFVGPQVVEWIVGLNHRYRKEAEEAKGVRTEFNA